jgi:hypothetical protein
MIVAIFKIVAIFYAVWLALFATGSVMTTVSNWKSARSLSRCRRERSRKQRAEFEKLMKSGGPKTRLVSFEVRRNE